MDTHAAASLSGFYFSHDGAALCLEAAVASTTRVSEEGFHLRACLLVRIHKTTLSFEYSSNGVCMIVIMIVLCIYSYILALFIDYYCSVYGA